MDLQNQNVISNLPNPGFLLATHRTESTFEEIPIIDLANANSRDPVVRRELADLIRDACINVGFFYIKGHGIPEETIVKAVKAAKEFFLLPTEVKMELDIHKTPNFKGYTALLGENTNPDGKGDLHEGFDIGPELYSDSSPDTVNAMSGANVWPAESALPEFKDSVLAYYDAAVHLGRSLFPLFALALDLPEDFFDDKYPLAHQSATQTSKSAAIMRLLYYPPQEPSSVDSDDGIMGIGAHTDYECFTILWQDTVGALQVQNAAGKWVDAVPIEGTVVLNLGDQFARWTNDIFKSTPHRAVNRSGLSRYSIPLFFGTNYDVLLEPLPGCVTPGSPAKYEVVSAGEYVRSRLEATYQQSA